MVAALIAALGILPGFYLPFAAGVPITAQTLGVMLAGLILGPRDGSLAVFLFLFVVALGAPLLAGGRGGLGVFFGPSVGYLLGFPAGAWAIGHLMRRLKGLPVFSAALLGSLGGGVLAVHVCGVIGLIIVAKMTLFQAAAATLVFVPGDVLKAIAAAFVAEAAVRAYPAALAGRA
jgi:biotin transport system substrate-specific component